MTHRKYNPHSLASARAKNKEPDTALVVFDAEKEPSLTVQSEADACDINKIMKHFEKTGSIEHLSKVPQRYGDVSNVGSYKDMLDYVTGVQSEFNLLPPDIRQRFNNDAGQMLDWLLDPSNEQEAIKLGWLEKAGAAGVAATSQTQAAPAAAAVEPPPKVV